MPAALKRKQEDEERKKAEAEAKAKAEKKAKRPKPAARPDERPSRAVPIAAGVGAVLAAVIGFVIAGSGGGEETPPQRSAPVAASGVQVVAPGGWARDTAPPEIPGLEIEGAAAASNEGKTETVVVGMVPELADNFALLPPAFLQSLGTPAGEAPEREAVRLGDVQAFRYQRVEPEGFGKPVTVYVAPTSEGVATLACVSPTADCETIATSLKISSGEPFPVGPNKEYGSAVSEALSSVSAARKKGTSQMRSAKTPRAQAGGATTIAKAYSGAARSLRGLEVSPADRTVNDLLATALADTGKAWSAAAKAARSNDKGDYSRAGRAITNGQRDVARALSALEAAGYKVS